MKKYILFFLFLALSSTAASAQTAFADTIQFVKSKLPVKFNGVEMLLDFEPNGTELVIGQEDLLKIQQGKIPFYNTKNSTQDKGNETHFELELDTLKLDCVILTKVPLKGVLVKKGKQVKSKIGGDFLRNYVNVTEVQGGILLDDIFDNYRAPECRTSAQPVRPTVSAAFSSGVREVRIIPCDASPATQTQKNEVFQHLNMLGCTLSEETNIPPAAALQSIATGITVRYFQSKDANKAREILEEIKDLLPGANCRLDRLSSHYNSQNLGGYFEVWVR